MSGDQRDVTRHCPYKTSVEILCTMSPLFCWSLGATVQDLRGYWGTFGLARRAAVLLFKTATWNDSLDSQTSYRPCSIHEISAFQTFTLVMQAEIH